MRRVALWDRCTAAGGPRLHPSHDAPRALFARAKPAPGAGQGSPPSASMARSMGGAVRALASQCDPGSTVGLDVRCGVDYESVVGSLP